jgi:hypothetical protein
MIEMLLFCYPVYVWHITFLITQDCLHFSFETPKFAPWAVLGEGCSSARDPAKDPGALILHFGI